MKFFAALIAKLTGAAADAPKTLEQARATFGEAKAALEKVVAMFAAAKLDFDDLMAKGENALRDHIAGIQQIATSLQAQLVTAQEQLATAKTDLAAAQASNATATTGYSTLLDTLGFKPAELIVSAENCAKYGVAQDEAFNKLSAAAQQSAIVKAAFAHAVGARATAQVAEMGIDPKKLPPQSTTTSAETLEELQTAMSSEKDPVKLGQLAAKANKLRDQLYASAS